MDDATLSLNEVNLGYSASELGLIDGNFKAGFHSDTTDDHGGSKEFVIELATSKTIITSFVVNRSSRFGETCC